MGQAERRGAGFTKRVVLLTVVVALVGLAGTAVVVYRVFRPRDTLTRPTIPYPAAVMITDERPFSELRAAPLVIEGRLRVYAEARRVWSDAPVGGRYESTPYWAFRRFPAEVVGVVDVETAAGPYIISQWSDSELIALNARTGAIAWRLNTPAAETSYDGRRTGASTVYEPRSLLTARSGDRDVVVVTSNGAVRAFDASTGAILWQAVVPGGCQPVAWTGSGLLAIPDCAGPVVRFRAVENGSPRGVWTPSGSNRPPVPALCQLGRSECRLVTVGAAAWLLTAGPNATFTALPSLEKGAVLAGDRVIYPTATGIAVRRLTDGAPLWTWNGKGALIAADSVGVYLLTADHTLLGLSPVTGRLSVLGCASSKADENWRPGHIYTTDSSYIAIERLTGAPPSSKDSVYYYGPRPIALVELYPPTKLPVWSGKFAACAPQS
jgi:outer membrane protein assembly factor BamB